MPVRTSKEIVYDRFLDCKKLCLGDKYWEIIFDGLARAKPPRGIYLLPNGDITKYTKRKHETSFTYSIEKKTPEEIVTDLKDLFYRHTNICPKESLKQKEMEVVDNLKKNGPVYKSWKSIKRKIWREYLLLLYVNKISSKFKLSTSSGTDFYKDLKCRFLFFNESPDLIELKNGIINRITGYECQNGIMVWINGKRPIKGENKKQLPNDKQILLSYFWKKIIKTKKSKKK